MQSMMKCKINTVLLVMIFSTLAFGMRIINLGIGNPKDSDVKIARPPCYDPTQASMIPCSKALEEKYMMGSEADEKRVKETPQKGRVTGTLGQIVVEFADGKSYTGTGSRAKYSGQDSLSFLLTCAHNFVRYSVVHGRLEYCKSAYFYEGRDGLSKYGQRHRLVQLTIHPRYEESGCTCHSGYDIAVASFETRENWNNLLSTDCYWGNTSSGYDCKIGSNIYLTGYPGWYGGKINEGYQYSMRGTIYTIKETRFGGSTVAYKDLDTTPGQSGAPVMIDNGGKYKLIFAVHVGGIEGSVNWGTVITPEIHQWIQSTQKHFLKYFNKECQFQ